jgi:outer membrane lipoprotein carrier protein
VRNRIRSGILLAGFFLAVLCLLGSPRLRSDDTSDAAKALAKRLEAHYHDIRTLRAVFLERYSDGPQSATVESGTVYFRRPGRMRWEYESPEKKLFVADGKNVWFYVPSDKTVTREPMKESSDWRTPLALLTGKANLSRLCSRVDLAGPAVANPRHAILRCLPKGEEEPRDSGRPVAPYGSAELPGAGQFAEVLLEVDSKTGQLARVEIHQPSGVELEYRFGDWKENLPLPEEYFRYHAPPGVAIVDGAALKNATP